MEYTWWIHGRLCTHGGVHMLDYNGGVHGGLYTVDYMVDYTWWSTVHVLNSVEDIAGYKK